MSICLPVCPLIRSFPEYGLGERHWLITAKPNTTQALVLRSQNSRGEAGRQTNTEGCYGVRVNVSIRDGESCQCGQKVLWGQREEAEGSSREIGFQRGLRQSWEGNSEGRGRGVQPSQAGAVGKATGRDGAGMSGCFCSLHHYHF